MDEVHRKTIQRHYKSLVQEANIYSLLPKLAEKNVFSKQMIESYTNSNKNELERKRKMFDDIERRGPNAWQKLLEALEESGHYKLRDMLINDIGIEESNVPVSQTTVDIEEQYANSGHVYPFIMPVNMEKNVKAAQKAIANDTNSSVEKFMNFSETPMTIEVKAADQFYDEINNTMVPVYRMRGKKRGILLLINNIKFIDDREPFRKGAEVDEVNLIDLFKQFGFEIANYRDLTLKGMKQVIKKFASNDNPQLIGIDSVFVTIMSHGYNRNVAETSVVSSDGLLLSTNWIIEQFNNENCYALQHKPKVFLFQACRGDSLPHAVHRISMDGQSNNSIIRNYSDILIGYCTIPGFQSHRDTQLGTWYTQIICDVFMNHAHDTHVEDLLKIVDHRMSNLQTTNGTMQTSMYENWGFKLCYLHPKLSA